VSEVLSTGILMRALAAALWIPPLIWLISFRRLAARLGRPHPMPPFDDAALAGWVDDLLRRLPEPWRYTCLKRAAVLYHLLRGAGRPLQLVIGVRRSPDGKLAAHAWLLLENVVYLEPEPEAPGAHTVIAVFPDPSAAT
jgi:hypothetical protein